MNISNYNHSNNWVEIPSHLLDQVLDKLKLTKDYLQAGAVCRTWHSISKENQIKRITSMPIDKQIPMLLIPDIENIDDNAWRLFDITNNQLLDTKFVVPYTKRFCGSSRGWVVAVNEDWSLTLYKPFSNNRQRISLPCLNPPSPEELKPFSDVDDDFINKVLITADPLTNPDECVIVVSSGKLEGFAFIRLTKDSNWTLIQEIDEYGDVSFFDFMYHGDHLYLVGDSGEIYSFNLKDPYNSTLNLIIPHDGVKALRVNRYIVDQEDGTAIVVRRYFKIDDESGIIRETYRFALFLVYIDGRGKNPRRLKDIGNKAIFLGDNHSICVDSSNFNGCRPSCIYFTHDLDGLYSPKVTSDLGVYDIKTEKFEFHFNMNSTTLGAMKNRSPIWVAPMFNAY